MTSALNRLQQLNGSKIMQKHFFLYLLGLLIFVASCTPKVGELRSPDYKGDVGAGVDKDKTDAEKDEDKGDVEKKDKLSGSNIALLLPFQLHQISSNSILKEDVNRSALALDFYQGFQMGLEESSKSKNIFLNVQDSRDDNVQNATLAKSADMEDMSIIVGPVYPKEIRTFGDNFSNKNVLQVNPLAASMPSEFNLPNLVSLTPSIKAHSTGIAQEVARQFRSGDIVLVYNTSDNDARQFLEGMADKIHQAKSGVRVISVSSIGQLEESLSATGVTHVVAGTTDKLLIRALVNSLTGKWNESAYNIRLYGHPLWDRYDWSIYSDFASFHPKITAESTLKPWTTAAREFREQYVNKYGVQPSDHSYKGYDCARYFSGLLNKYDKDALKEHLVEEPYQGLYSNYEFTHNPAWGFSNSSVAIRVYNKGGFQLQ